MMKWAALLLLPTALAAAPRVEIENAKVSVETRNGVSWCVLDSRVSGVVEVPIASLVAVIEDYASYPSMFPRIREVATTRTESALLLTEKVVVQAMGVTVSNTFTLRVFRAPSANPRELRIEWTTESTDGSIDSLRGFWSLVDVGTPTRPQTRVIYQTTSAVPFRFPGQDVFVGMFLGGETRAVLETVFKKAGAR